MPSKASQAFRIGRPGAKACSSWQSSCSRESLQNGLSELVTLNHLYGRAAREHVRRETWDKLKQGGIAIIDYGSQYTQLIARRIRELGVYSEVYTHDGRAAHISQHDPAGYILSGGPDSVYASGSPHLQPFVLDSGKPILGICYGLQLLTHAFGGKVASAKQKEYGPATITHAERSPLFDSLPSELGVWMSHGDRIEEPPAGFVALAESGNAPFAAIGDLRRRYFGVQFHREVNHSRQGKDILANFLFKVCGCVERWTPAAFIDDSITRIREKVGDENVLLALSGAWIPLWLAR